MECIAAAYGARLGDSPIIEVGCASTVEEVLKIAEADSQARAPKT